MPYNTDLFLRDFAQLTRNITRNRRKSVLARDELGTLRACRGKLGACYCCYLCAFCVHYNKSLRQRLGDRSFKVPGERRYLNGHGLGFVGIDTGGAASPNGEAIAKLTRTITPNIRKTVICRLNLLALFCAEQIWQRARHAP